jgi:Acetyltransferase (GNAT) domain
LIHRDHGNLLEERSGYLSPEYAATFESFGKIITLSNSGLQLIQRPIDEHHFDLRGVYPYSMCRNWAKLADDAAQLADTGAVSVVLVADPFEEGGVRRVMRDWTLCRDYKTHLVVDLSEDWRAMRSESTRRYTRRAQALHEVVVASRAPAHAREFWEMYQNTIERHHLTGIQRLSEDIIADQLKIEGSMLVVARDEFGIAGALFSYVHGDTANGHLLALSNRAYKIHTSHALYYGTLEAAEVRNCRYYNFGGAAGFRDNPADGLYYFKRGWASHTRKSLLCGQILDWKSYHELLADRGNSATGYFPAYRGASVA